MPTSPIELTPRERLLVAVYRRRELTVTEILVTHDATREELYRALSRAREPFRRPASARPGRVLLRRAPVELPPGREDREGRLARRLARLLSARIAELEDRAWPGRSADPEATAKALALSVSTLATLRRAGIDPDGHHSDASPHEPPPRSLAALRDELYGHMLRIRNERRRRRGDGCAEADQGRDGGAAAPLAQLLPGESKPSGG